MWETWVWSLGWEDPLEKRKATHSSILAGEFHGLYSPWGQQRVGYDWVTSTFLTWYSINIIVYTFPISSSNLPSLNWYPWKIYTLFYGNFNSIIFYLSSSLSFTKGTFILLFQAFVTISSVWSFIHVWLCNPMNRSTPGLPVYHQHPEFTQTHVHWVGEAIQPSHPLSSPSPPAFNLS